ncbi:hypothetical protein F8S09_13160 [Deinococcus sp. SDU3-2]|uniref:O-antigen ligase domain-containing protein n=1 Tax=Deinococcus terrestris TaxID=2651870 RepID=A0A7X1NXG8_9DEIO|nr:hypothetical protein [Deinococcus terrestris]MPY67621.1 hypothetical protein [Deinococcus terrestris]
MPAALYLPFYLYFFVILMLPVSANGLKAGLAALAALATFLQLTRRGRFTLHPSTLRAALLALCTSLAWLLYGLLRQNPGALFSTLIYLIWPTFYLVVFTTALSSWSVYRVLRRLMLLSLLLLSLFILYFVAYSFGLAPATPLLALPFGQGIAKYEGFTALRFYAISTLIFLIPYAAAKLLFPAPGAGRWQRGLTAAAFLLGVAAILFTGRRAALVTVALAVPLTLTLVQFSPGPLRRRATRGMAGLVCLAVLGGGVSAAFFEGPRVLIGSLAGQVSRSLFASEQTADDVVRVEQADSLLDGWVKSPLVGAGLGATTGYLRSERSWNYELQYHMHLFQMGVLGVLLYGLGIAWIFRNGVRIIRRGGEAGSEMTALLTGLTCFLVANATNPYLQAYGHLWTLFLPVAVINLMKRRGQI